MWLVRLPVGYTVGILLGFGLPGVFVSNVLDSGVRALVNWLRFRGGKWQRMRV
jgi:Na+-driven multidrug efflux pump